MKHLPDEALGIDDLEPVITNDPTMHALMRRVEDVAPSNAGVLITGESGAGKELIASHLHRASNRSGAALIALNCATPDVLLESELFGHEQGAFYAAGSRRIGKFEAATGGTLLLDEIAEMDLRIQAKLLRAIEQGEVDPVGSARPVRVDARIVATTSKDLQKEVRLGRFRADLLFRLNVIALKVPPLRERTADLPSLATFFARKFALENGRPVCTISTEALSVLRQHTWPGNVRELENVIYRAVLSETGPEITPRTLDIEPGDNSPSSEPLIATPTAGRTIESVEKDMILEALGQRMGNRARTAAALGISIRTLRNKLNEYERAGTRIPRPVVTGVA